MITCLYIFVSRKQAVNADELNKSIIWIHLFKTESFVDHLCYFCLVFAMLLCVSVYWSFWSPAWKALTSWLSSVMSNCEVGTFPLVCWVRCAA